MTPHSLIVKLTQELESAKDEIARLKTRLAKIAEAATIDESSAPLEASNTQEQEGRLYGR